MNNNTNYWYVLRMHYRLACELDLTTAERWEWAYKKMPEGVVSLTDMNSLECKLLGKGIERPPV